MGGANWRDLVNDAIAVRAAEVREKSPGASNYVRISRVGFSVAAHVPLVRAAKMRGISLAGYIRRATLAFVAHDLGLNPIDLFEMDLGIKPRRGDRGLASKDLDGALYGKWEVRPNDAGTDAESAGDSAQD